MCQEITTGAHKCKACEQYVHAICGIAEEGNEGYGSVIICNLSFKSQLAAESREEAFNNLKLEAEKMINSSDKLLTVMDIGKNVTVSIPSVDKGRVDFRNIMAVVLEQINNNYRLGTENGIISRLFPRSKLTFVEQNFFGPENVPQDIMISLRQESTLSSFGHGQGVIKCNCRKNCFSKRCICKSKNIFCNSRCHNSNSCFNK